jgi:membrane-bound metal-dependent hydrolase YbcI (DUF457 family)
MFAGHYAIALAAKRTTPTLSLGVLFAACQLVDLIWPVFLLLGIEHVRIAPGITAVTPLDFYDYPWTHSLAASLFWALAAGAAYYAWRRRAKPAMVIGIVVLSHWFLDLLAHRPDLPLYPGSPTKLGLGLWNSPIATAAVELTLFAIGLALYTTPTRPLDRKGSLGFWSLIAFLLAIYASTFFSAPPPSEKAVAWLALTAWLIPLWAWWSDRHRVRAN